MVEDLWKKDNFPQFCRKLKLHQFYAKFIVDSNSEDRFCISCLKREIFTFDPWYTLFEWKMGNFVYLFKVYNIFKNYKIIGLHFCNFPLLIDSQSVNQSIYLSTNLQHFQNIDFLVQSWYQKYLVLAEKLFLDFKMRFSQIGFFHHGADHKMKRWHSIVLKFGTHVQYVKIHYLYYNQSLLSKIDCYSVLFWPKKSTKLGRKMKQI